MDVLRIRGGHTLKGSIPVSGAKNACLPIFAATLLTDEPCYIDNVPNLSDIRFLAEILRHMGAEVENTEEGKWKIQAGEIKNKAPYDLVRKMRASVCLMGPLIARKKKCEVALPGGCVIGPRPIDLHLKGFKKLGAKVNIEGGYVNIDATNAKGAHIFLGGRYGSTVTGTANVIMAAVMTPGKTVIESAAQEPELEDLCNMLIKMGADITGIGSHTITIRGVDKLKGCTHSVIADRIEAATFIIGAGMTKSDITVTGIVPEHIGALLDKLELCGLPFELQDGGSIHVKGSQLAPKPSELITMPYPGFATDMQAQMCALLSLTPGLSIITERIYPNRFMHVSELQRMGADIAIEGPSAIIQGVDKLSGAPVMASDLRASAALVLAGMAASGDTWVQRIYHLDRGYEKIDQKLNALGAEIERLSDSEMPKDILDS